jgi:large subunit ribosomal protein L21
VKALAPPFLTKLPLADEVAHSVLSHGFAYWNVASAAECSVRANGAKCGLTGLGAAAYPGPSVRTLRRAPCVCPQTLVLHTIQIRQQVESRSGVYAIVRSGGRQHKVAVGDVLEIDLLDDAVGSSISLTPLLLVDGDTVTSDVSALGSASVTAEVLAETKGPKIRILKFKNKTGYRKRQGHRQRYTKVLVTDIKS